MRKSLVVCATQFAGCLLLKKLKYFEAMLNIFQISRVWEIIESWLVYVNKLFWIMLCILYLKSIHKIVFDKKLINIDWLMLQCYTHSMRPNVVPCCCCCCYNLLRRSSNNNIHNNKKTQFKYENSTKASRLHFSDLQYIYVCRYASYISYS